MIDSLIGLLLSAAVVLIALAAFLGAWLAFWMNARRLTPKPPEPAPEEETPHSGSPAAAPAPRAAEPPPVRHAFDFSGDQVSMILEMPVSLLADDAALADVWVDVVGWARMAWEDVEAGNVPVTAQSPEAEGESLDESEITREHLEGSLQRLHDAAERRRELRLKLAERRHGAQELATG